MKTKNFILFLGFLLIIFQSCIPSLHPLYTADKLIMKKELEGTWVNSDTHLLDNLTFSSDGTPLPIDASKDTPVIWTFEARDDKSYNLTFYDEDRRPGYFRAHLIKLGPNYYLNFHLDDSFVKEEASQKNNIFLSSNKFNSFEMFHIIPANTFAKVAFEPEGISMALFDGEFLEKLLDQKRIRIKHEKLEDGYILTAQPEELQQFILKYGDDEKAFPDASLLQKAI